MATDYPEQDVNYKYWPGPSAAGMAKPTVPAVQAGANSAGMDNGVWHGLNAIGTPKTNVGPGAIGQPTYPPQPT